MRLRLPFALSASLAATLAAPLASPPPQQAPSRPALIVLLVVDQMRADYALKYGHQWKAGLRRLVDEGAWFQQAMYPYSNTVTCAGHATVSTGSFPRTHGIVDNSWFDRESGSTINCFDDPAQRTISYGAPIKGGKGPARLMTATLTDNIRWQLPVAPHVATFSMKERTAIMLAGRRADAVTWFDTAARSFASSSAYTQERVPFVDAFIKAHPIERDIDTPWTPLQPASAYLFSDASKYERPPSFWTNAFPHPLRSAGATPDTQVEAWVESPASDAYLERLGEAAIESLRLGQGPGTDILGISFSALDHVGHAFGPQSHEVQDVLARLDRALGALLAQLDRRVGRGRYVVALTADHGVSPIPEQLADEGLPVGRLPATAFTGVIEQALQSSVPAGARVVARSQGGQVYLHAAAATALDENGALRRRLRAELERVPGIARVLFAAERESWMASGDPIARATALSQFPGRSADITVQPRAYWLFGGPNGSAASHGTPYRYDQWVPLFLFGHGIKAGRYTNDVTPADIAPTLAWLCGATLPHADGRPLLEALAPSTVRPVTAAGKATGPSR